MSDGIVIIGSGFAARQLVKNIRKQDAQIPLTLIAADSMDEYNKPDLSHVISRGQKADDLTLQSAGEFAEQYTLRLFPHTWVSDIDAENRLVKSHDNQWRYDKLVLATGATPFIPSVPGRELMLTLNSQREYGAAQSRLHDAKRVLIVGGGLIGCELAMDFCRAGKAVTVVDNSASVLAALMPPEASSRLAASAHRDGRTSDAENAAGGAGANRRRHSRQSRSPARDNRRCGGGRRRPAPGNVAGAPRRTAD